MIIPAAAGPLGHIALVHEDPERAEDLARLLRTAGHRVTAVVPGRRIVQGVVDCSPDLLLASHSLVDPPMASVVKGVRQALGPDVRILVLYGFDPQGAPADVDEVSRVAGMRLTVAFGFSSLAVWMLGPMVKNIGFANALWIMAGIAALKAAIVWLLPDEPDSEPVQV